MKRIFLTLVGLFIMNFSFGQYLYPEKFEGCNINDFFLDGGDIKAEPPLDFNLQLISNLNSIYLKVVKGTIEVQILVDTVGNPCLLSAKNNSNVKTKKLDLQYAINKVSKWAPALRAGKPINKT